MSSPQPCFDCRGRRRARHQAELSDQNGEQCCHCSVERSRGITVHVYQLRPSTAAARRTDRRAHVTTARVVRSLSAPEGCIVRTSTRRSGSTRYQTCGPLIRAARTRLPRRSRATASCAPWSSASTARRRRTCTSCATSRRTWHRVSRGAFWVLGRRLRRVATMLRTCGALGVSRSCASLRGIVCRACTSSGRRGVRGGRRSRGSVRASVMRGRCARRLPSQRTRRVRLARLAARRVAASRCAECLRDGCRRVHVARALSGV